MSAGASDAQELYRVLQECQQLITQLNGEATRVIEKRQEITEVYITLQQALRLFWRLSRQLERMGLSEDFSEAMNRLTGLARAATYTYYAFLLLAKGTPYGYFAGTLGLIAMAMNITALSPMEGY